jgi:hypothetical protein
MRAQQLTMVATGMMTSSSPWLLWAYYFDDSHWCHHVCGYCGHTILMIPVDFRRILTWDQLHWKNYLLTFLRICRTLKRSMDATLASILVWMWLCHSSHKHDDVNMPVATLSILFWWFPFISDKFWHETNYIKKIILLPLYTYVERKNGAQMRS